MKSICFRAAFALSSAAFLMLPGSASAQSSPTLQLRTSFAGQYDTDLGWRPTYGTPSRHYPDAAPTIAAGQYEGQTRLFLGTYNSLGQFFNALQGPDNIHNAQQDLASVFGGVSAGYLVTQAQILRDLSPVQLPGQPVQLWDRYVIAARANNPNTNRSYIVFSVTRYNPAGEAGQCTYWFDTNDSQTNGMYADSPRVNTNGNALLLTANMYSFSDNSFQYAKLWMYPKTSIYNDPSLGACPAAGPPLP